MSSPATPIRVLAIDDDDDIQALLRVALKTGFVVTSAMDGEEALDWLNRGTFDVILLDMNLPDMTGYDVLSSARRRRIETPCLLLTAENSSAAIAPVLKLGVASYIPKPINPKELGKQIKKALEPPAENQTALRTLRWFRQSLNRFGSNMVKSWASCMSATQIARR